MNSNGPQYIENFFQTRYIKCNVRSRGINLEHKWWNRELTLKCKFKCYVKPMKDPLGVSPSKGNQGTTRGKEKIIFDLGGNRTHDLRNRSTVTSS